MIKLENIQSLGNLDRHKLVRYQAPLPGHSIDKSNWYDQYGIGYKVKDNNLIIYNISNISSLINHINNIKEDIDITLVVNNVKVFNELCRKSYLLRKKVTICLEAWMEIDRFSCLDFEFISDNVKIKTRDKSTQGDHSFDWWCLWLNDKDFACVTSKLTCECKKRQEELRNIVNEFFKNNPDLALQSDYKKVNYVYNWCLQNTKYDTSAVNSDGTLNYEFTCSQDPLYTYKMKRGVCAGRSRLMKVLLNNRIMRVDCFLTDGNFKHLQHEWNEVYFPNGEVLYYDLSYNISNCPDIEKLHLGHSNITHKDALKWHFKLINNSKTLKKVPPLPKRN